LARIAIDPKRYHILEQNISGINI